MFMRDLSVIERRMRIYAERSLSHLGIGFPEQVVVMQLSAHGICRQEDLAAHFSIDKGSIAKTVGKLESKGLVRRECNPADRREKLVELTEQGEAVVGSMADAYRVLEERMFKGLNQEELDVASRALERIAINLTEEEED